MHNVVLLIFRHLSLWCVTSQALLEFSRNISQSFLQHVHKQFQQQQKCSSSNFLPIKSVHMIAVAPGLRLQISLMVVLSRPELCCGENMCLDEVVLKSFYFTGQYFILDFLLYFFCNFHLVLIVAENGWGVLCALVIHLPVLLRRVMEREEELDQLLKACFCVVE